MTSRNFQGYGNSPPKVVWPNNARIAISVVVNYEEGSEYSILDGDETHESNNEVPSPVPSSQRDLANESFFEYGSRVGVWRIMNILDRYSIPASFFCCALALERNPIVGPEIVRRGHEVVGHGYRWEEYYLMDIESERKAIKAAVKSLEKTTGVKPQGWYTRYAPSEKTRELIASTEGFIYDSNSYSDDIPYYEIVNGKPWLIVPYSLEVNDTRFWRGGMNRPSDFLETLKNTFDLLYEEGLDNPKIMNIGLHCRIAGRPSRTGVLKQFFEYVSCKPDIWFARRDEIAKWWLQNYPPTHD
ncbi:MAG TPA: allantoinase [Dehalococcoidia bacterium]|nr:allantoinase [Chloroflexota bacterium]HBF01201.1 allantoinase [Dehalococcoidia bacterium]|tara:strand:+ start:2479 stop:3378 length:900 start_codon:yes stop_codon:yes gene_type:complete